MLFLWFLSQGKSFWASLSHGIISILMMILLYRLPDLYVAQFSLVHSIIYFIADSFTGLDIPKLVHHIVSGIGCALAFTYDLESQIFAAKVLGILELSGPCWTFFRLRIKNSDEISLPNWYNKSVAGIVFMITFFWVRFIHFNYVLYIESPPNFDWNVVIFFYIFLQALNVYWMSLLVKGAMKEFQKIQWPKLGH